MARRLFNELLTPFLRGRLAELETLHGADSPEYEALARQYLKTENEEVFTPEANLRHYEADTRIIHNGAALPGVERLYRRTLVIEPTLACAAHCRYCIRANYPRHNLTEDQLAEIARYCGSAPQRDSLREVLITGGDVLLVPQRVGVLLDALAAHAPNIRVARIATRLPVQAPERINGDVLALFEKRGCLRVELGTQINHKVELCSQSVAALQAIMDRGVRVYSQNVLLRGVNDDVDCLVELYDALRELQIEPHYLFHCVPLQGMRHLRTSLDTALDSARALSACGELSGRAKPLLAAMTDIGKVVLYEGAILDRTEGRVLLQSHYRLDDRRRWNPNWRLPESAALDAEGRMRVWYLDGDESLAAEEPGATIGHVIDLPILAGCS